VQAVCDRVGIIRAGQLIAIERVDTLIKRSFRRLRLTLEKLPAEAAFNLEGVREVERFDSTVTLEIRQGMQAVMERALRYGLRDVEEQPALWRRSSSPTTASRKGGECLASFATSSAAGAGAIIGWGLGAQRLRPDLRPLLSDLDAGDARSRLREPALPGDGQFDMATFEGYFASTILGFMALLIAIYAVVNGTGTLAGEEESGVLELMVTLPLHRWQIVLSKAIAMAVAGVPDPGHGDAGRHRGLRAGRAADRDRHRARHGAADHERLADHDGIHDD
jgi:hypothetical protein